MLDLQKCKLRTEDSEKSEWFDFDDEGTRFKVGRIGNKQFLDALTRLRKPYEHLTRRGKEIPENIGRKITAQAMAEGLLFDWEGIVNNGEPAPYDEELAAKILAAKEYQHISDFIVGCGETMEARYKSSYEDAMGN